jgi:hypothetical protein
VDEVMTSSQVWLAIGMLAGAAGGVLLGRFIAASWWDRRPERRP